MKRKNTQANESGLFRQQHRPPMGPKKYIVCDHLTKKLDSSQSMRAFTTLVLSCRQKIQVLLLFHATHEISIRGFKHSRHHHHSSQKAISSNAFIRSRHASCSTVA